MDPTQTLREMIGCAKHGDRRSYEEHSEALYWWLLKGGFEPEQVSVFNTVKYSEDDHERFERFGE